jgi:hypothetical protein
VEIVLDKYWLSFLFLAACCHDIGQYGIIIAIKGSSSILMRKKNTLFYLFFLLVIFRGVFGFSQTLPTPTISFYGMGVLCQGETTYLGSSATQGNLWSNGATTQTISVTNTGTFYVQQIVGNYTSLPSASVSVTVLPFIQATLNPVGSLCSDSPPVLLQGLPPGGIFYGSSILSTSLGLFFVPSMFNLGSNNIIVYRINAPGYPQHCIDTASIRIVVNHCTEVKNNLILEDHYVTVHPNPGIGLVTILALNSAIIQRLRLIDLNGNEVVSLDNIKNSKVSFDLSSFTNGIYLAELSFVNSDNIQRLRVFKSD